MDEFKVKGKSTWDIWSGSDEHNFSKDSSLFSSSLPVFRHEKLNVNDHVPGCSLTDDISSSSIINQDIKQFGSFGGVENYAIEDFLPDNDDEFLAGIINGLDFDPSPRMDNLDEYDLFGSGGGLEIESDARESLNFNLSRLTLSDSANGNGMALFLGHNSVGSTVTGEHPLGEHPSRTLFVRNINSNVEDSELKELFQRFGDIRTLYTTCKHRGFVMISYYDIRAARAALRELQNTSLRKRKLDIHFSIPKDNPSDKDLNQGTLVVFNLDPSVSNEDLLKIFGAYGEVKEIRETPHKRHHKFVEFYDVRDADVALRSLNRQEIAGRRIKVELSRPGGTRRNLMVHSGQDLFEPDELPSFRHQMAASFGNSSPGNWPRLGSPLEQSTLSSLSKSADFRSLSPILHNMSGLDSIFQHGASNSTRVAAPTDLDNMLNNGKNAGYRSAFQQPLSFPESYSSQFSGSASSFGASNSNGSGIETFRGPQFLWGSSSSPKLYSEPFSNSSSLRGQSFGHHPLASNEPAHAFSFSGSLQAQRPHYHDVGSAPSGFPFEKQAGFYQGGVDFRPKDRNFTMNPGARTNVSSSVNISVSKQSFDLDVKKIRNGEDIRTTLMLKNIPNKYTSNMLLADIDENNKGTYDFFYLPIDFKNQCNVGYAFINLLSPSHIIPFYEAFNGRKWDKFNSGKVACLAYARIQGKAALVSHFENSGLMNVDIHCRPILFQSDGSDSGHQGNLPLNSNFQVRRSNGLDRKEPSGSSKDDGRCVDQVKVKH